MASLSYYKRNYCLKTSSTHLCVCKRLRTTSIDWKKNFSKQPVYIRYTIAKLPKSVKISMHTYSVFITFLDKNFSFVILHKRGKFQWNIQKNVPRKYFSWAMNFAQKILTFLIWVSTVKSHILPGTDANMKIISSWSVP